MTVHLGFLRVSRTSLKMTRILLYARCISHSEIAQVEVYSMYLALNEQNVKTAIRTVTYFTQVTIIINHE